MSPRDVPATARLVPLPASLTVLSGAPFTLSATAPIVVEPANAEVARIAEQLGELLRYPTGFAMPVLNGGVTTPLPGSIVLRLDTEARPLPEAYQLVVTSSEVRITAGTPAGIFRGVQTLRQLFPSRIESHMKLADTGWTVPAISISDHPRFAWRGAMLDVARHFFTVDEVKQYIDILALYKLNVLHLHLSDDQGWRIEIKSRPRLASIGSMTQVGGGPGGFYTQSEYAEIVRYAQDRYVTIVPEIDLPGHTNAALTAYPDVSCSKRPAALYTGTDVGWSTFCPDKEETYAIIDDVVREIAAMTPGQYFHMGGDEVEVLTHEQYAKFVERVQDIVNRHGKQMVGWEEVNKARLKPGTLVQQWHLDTISLQPGGKLLMSPAKRMYLDMKYTPATELGLTWAAIIEMDVAYNWDPAMTNPGVAEADILGVEAPMWSETLRNMTAVQYLAMPRLPAAAEVGWTPQAQRSFESFRRRVATHAPRWNYLGINYYRSPQIPW